MLSKALLLAVVGTALSANAAIYPGHLAVKRDLIARQTETDTAFPSDTALPSGEEACLTALASIYDALPTAPPDIISWEMTYSVTDPCSYSIPKSLESEFSSYEVEVESFYSVHSSEIESALSQCPSYSTDYSSLQSTDTDTDYYDYCSTAGSGGATTGALSSVSATTTGTKTASTHKTSTAAGGAPSSAGSSSVVSQNIGPRETGLIAAAVAAAGFIGVVAVL